MENRYSWLGSGDSCLGDRDDERRAGWHADRLAIKQQQRLPVGGDAQRGSDELRRNTRSVSNGRSKCAASHDVRARDGNRRLPRYGNAWIGRCGLRLAAMRAHHRGSHMQQESRHQTTTSAPLLMVTEGPAMTILAPLPFWI